MKPRRICRIIILTISSYSWYKEGDINKTWEGVIRFKNCKSHYTTIYCKNKCIEKFKIKCKKKLFDFHYLYKWKTRIIIDNIDQMFKWKWCKVYLFCILHSIGSTQTKGVCLISKQNEFMSLIMVNGLCLDFVKQTFL